MSPTLAADAELRRSLRATGIRLGAAARDVMRSEGLSGPQAVCDALDAVARVGGRALLLGSVHQASSALDGDELERIREHAAAVGVELHASLAEFHPIRFDPRSAEASLHAGAIVGVQAYHATVGRMEDRFSEAPTWDHVLAELPGTLREWTARADRPVVLRTHEEMTTLELLHLIDSVGSDDLWIGFSPVNVVCRGEDPTGAWDRVRPRTLALFLDDCELVQTQAGASRRLRPIGDGIVPWTRILTDFAFSTGRLAEDATVFLDLAQAEFGIPFHDPEWVEKHTDARDGKGVPIASLTVANGSPSSPLAERRARGWSLLDSAHEIVS